MNRQVKKAACLVLACLMAASLPACSPYERPGATEGKGEEKPVGITIHASAVETSQAPSRQADAQEEGKDARPLALVQEEGADLEKRIHVPQGFLRVPGEGGSLQEFLRKYPLLPPNSPVRLYDGTEKGNQQAHVAIFDMALSNRDLQQCADSVMRIYGEYFWKTGQFDRISFHFVNGFSFPYSRWRQGWRVSIQGNDAKWVKKAARDESWDSFEKYLDVLFAYASTLSLSKESKPQELSQIKAGDVFLKGGSPGHVVMVVDVCVNEAGEKAFLLAQSYMPAQQFYVLKNPLHEADPWYYQPEFSWPLETPEYVFQEGSLRQLDY